MSKCDKKAKETNALPSQQALSIHRMNLDFLDYGLPVEPIDPSNFEEVSQDLARFRELRSP